MQPIVPKAILYCLLLIVVVFSYVATASETYYRWTDEHGNLLHSDRPPPPGIDYEVVSTDSHQIRRVDGKEGAVPLEVRPRVGNEFETSPKETKDFKKSPEICRRAKDNLAALAAGGKIRMRNDQGELRFLTEDQKASQIKRAEEVIEAHCE